MAPSSRDAAGAPPAARISVGCGKVRLLGCKISQRGAQVAGAGERASWRGTGTPGRRRAGGRPFPPKQVICLATGLDRADFTTHQARRILTRGSPLNWPRSRASICKAPRERSGVGGVQVEGAMARVALRVAQGGQEYRWDAPVWFVGRGHLDFSSSGWRGFFTTFA